jgi:hypothetical protein
MTIWATFLGVAGLAFLDSLNPFSIAAMALVIMGQNALSRGLVFVGATFATYMLGGVLLLAGWTQALKALLPLITPLVATIGWSLAALIAMCTAVWLWCKAPAADKPPEVKTNGQGLLGVFLFAIVSTASDVPTAIPYFGAIPMIEATHASILGQGAWLILYNLIYISPLILLLWLRLFASAQFEPYQAKIASSMDLAMRRHVPPFLVILGIWAAIEAFAIGGGL